MLFWFSKNTALVLSMARRDIIGRYKGSVLGLFWSLFNPLFMLAVYTFAFGFIFKAKWPGLADNPYSFALTLFPALLVFNFITECATRAPGLIVGNPSYVKKVVFPLEILPLVVAVSSLFHFFVGFIVWCLISLGVTGSLHLSLVLIPFILLPLVIFSLGLSWILASLGVYLRDIQQVIGVLMSALIFLSPVFYSIETVPEQFRSILLANPITHFVNMTRSIMVFGDVPSFGYWFMSLVGSIAFALFGAWWFATTRKGFADVL